MCEWSWQKEKKGYPPSKEPTAKLAICSCMSSVVVLCLPDVLGVDKWTGAWSNRGGGRVLLGVVPPQRALLRSWRSLLRLGAQQLTTAAPPFLVIPMPTRLGERHAAYIVKHHHVRECSFSRGQTNAYKHEKQCSNDIWQGCQREVLERLRPAKLPDLWVPFRPAVVRARTGRSQRVFANWESIAAT